MHYILSVHLFAFKNIRWQLKWKIVFFSQMDCDPRIPMVCDSMHWQRWLLNIYVGWNAIPLKWVAQGGTMWPTHATLSD